MILHITGHNYLPLCGAREDPLNLDSISNVQKCKKCLAIDKKRDRSLPQMGASDPFFSDGLTTESIKSLKIFFNFK